jgi:hypothetical protein
VGYDLISGVMSRVGTFTLSGYLGGELLVEADSIVEVAHSRVTVYNWDDRSLPSSVGSLSISESDLRAAVRTGDLVCAVFSNNILVFDVAEWGEDDSDGDSYCYLAEIWAGTDPFNADSNPGGDSGSDDDDSSGDDDDSSGDDDDGGLPDWVQGLMDSPYFFVGIGAVAVFLILFGFLKGRSKGTKKSPVSSGSGDSDFFGIDSVNFDSEF